MTTIENTTLRDKDVALFERIAKMTAEEAATAIWEFYSYAYEKPEGVETLKKKEEWVTHRMDAAKAEIARQISELSLLQNKLELLREDLENPEFAIGGSLFRPELYSTTTFVEALLENYKK